MWQQRCKVIVVFKPTDPPENGHKGIISSPPSKVAGSGAQLESPCTSAHSKGNKQEGEGATVGQQNVELWIKRVYGFWKKRCANQGTARMS